MKIWVNTIVNNEESFIWFSIMSVVDYVDQIVIYDTGSTDNTVKIIQEIQKLKRNKIRFKQMGLTSSENFPHLRQKMLEESNCDWVLIVDGDEIWWEDSIKKLRDEIKNKGRKIEGIVVPMVVPVGDIYHIQDETAGQYKLLGRKGHLSLRAISKKIPGLHVDWPYGKESYLDEDNKLVQERKGVTFLDTPYLHTTHLKRSNIKRSADKFKYELGQKVPENFRFPEVLSSTIPAFVASPWRKLSGLELLTAKLLTPLRKIKRKLN